MSKPKKKLQVPRLREVGNGIFEVPMLAVMTPDNLGSSLYEQYSRDVEAGLVDSLPEITFSVYGEITERDAGDQVPTLVFSDRLDALLAILDARRAVLSFIDMVSERYDDIVNGIDALRLAVASEGCSRRYAVRGDHLDDVLSSCRAGLVQLSSFMTPRLSDESQWLIAVSEDKSVDFATTVRGLMVYQTIVEYLYHTLIVGQASDKDDVSQATLLGTLGLSSLGVCGPGEDKDRDIVVSIERWLMKTKGSELVTTLMSSCNNLAVSYYRYLSYLNYASVSFLGVLAFLSGLSWRTRTRRHWTIKNGVQPLLVWLRPYWKRAMVSYFNAMLSFVAASLGYEDWHQVVSECVAIAYQAEVTRVTNQQESASQPSDNKDTPLLTETTS